MTDTMTNLKNGLCPECGKSHTMSPAQIEEAMAEVLSDHGLDCPECLDGSACAALLALGDGDAVSLAGGLTPKVWTDKTGNARPTLDIVAHQVLTAYHVQRRRKATNEPEQQD